MSETKKINRTKEVPICDVCNEESTSQGQTEGLLVDTEGLWVCGPCLVERAKNEYETIETWMEVRDIIIEGVSGDFNCMPLCINCDETMHDGYGHIAIAFDGQYACHARIECLRGEYIRKLGYKVLKLNDKELNDDE